jgi:hypothetical protein
LASLASNLNCSIHIPSLFSLDRQLCDEGDSVACVSSPTFNSQHTSFYFLALDLLL